MSPSCNATAAWFASSRSIGKLCLPPPRRFRTRVITEGVTPSLYVDYKSSRIKQYHKEGRALRTETTINNASDFRIGKRLGNLPALRKVGFAANRRLLQVQTLTQNCLVSDATLQKLQQPKTLASSAPRD